MNEKDFLSSYDVKNYRTPDGLPTDICIFTIVSEKPLTARKTLPKKTLKILLIQRKEHPFQNAWALPGGFSNENETLYAAAKRELKEETNIGDDFHLEQIKTIFYPGRDPRPNPDHTGTAWMPTAVYYAFVKEEFLKNIQAGDDAKDARLFSIEEAKQLSFAFDHKEIIFGGLKDLCGEEVEALAYIQHKMLHTTIAKEFLPKEFTISELLHVIQAVVPNFSVETPNFIRKMIATQSRKGIIEEVLDESGNPKVSDAYSQRAARLYRFTDHAPTISIYNSTLL